MHLLALPSLLPRRLPLPLGLLPAIGGGRKLGLLLRPLLPSLNSAVAVGWGEVRGVGILFDRNITAGHCEYFEVYLVNTCIV